MERVAREHEHNFLPPHLRAREPDFKVWWTGTLGQAEWLITHSKELSGRTITVECPKNISAIPESLKPLLALEQPDLLISTVADRPLMSIEITEQQEFGTNSQQRVARFWSAVANNVPSALIAPIESYQIERAEPLAKVFDEPDKALRKFLLAASTLPLPNGLPMKLWRDGQRAFDLESESTPDDLGLSEAASVKFRRFVDRFVRRNGQVDHLEYLGGHRFLHRVGSRTYKAYLRIDGLPTSMMLQWFMKASERVPTYIFRLQSDIRLLFRTNGLEHTMEDLVNPHLSFRNLPPGPGVSRPVDKRSKIDEITLFFEFVDSVVRGEQTPVLGRDMFTLPDEFYPAGIEDQWITKIGDASQISTFPSGDYKVNANTLREFLLNLHAALPVQIEDVLQHFTNVNIFKV